MEDENFLDPIVPALAVPLAKKSIEQKATGPAAGEEKLMGGSLAKEVLEYDEETELPTLLISDMPMCPKCTQPQSCRISDQLLNS